MLYIFQHRFLCLPLCAAYTAHLEYMPIPYIPPTFFFFPYSYCKNGVHQYNTLTQMAFGSTMSFILSLYQDIFSSSQSTAS